MPRGVLPDAARVLPPAGQKVWLNAFNSALDEGQPEEEASKEAWAAVKRAGYEKKGGGKWGKSMDTSMETSEHGFQFSAPILKIDVNKRIVGGFATLDNVDNALDLVDADASQEAFTQWFGNIREMHEKKAVGKAVGWEPKVFKDDDGTEYNGIWVEAKISRGAEDTWQKVLDGTLAGFSIGGATLEKQRTMAKTNDGEQQVWRITKYRLTELSLVDNPCNGLARVSLIKSLDGNITIDDIVSDDDMEKAYNGETGEHVDLTSSLRNVVSALESYRDEAVRNNADDVVAEVSSLLANVRSSCRYESMIADMHAESTYKSDDADNKEEVMEKSEETLTNEEISATSNVEELTEAERGLFRKFIDLFKVTEIPAEIISGEELTTEGEGETPDMNTEDLTKAIDDVKEELTKDADSKFEQIGTSLTAIVEKLEKVATSEAIDTIKTELKADIDALTERLTTLENSGGIKKSGDEAPKGDKLEKSDEGFWSGNILPDFLVK